MSDFFKYMSWKTSKIVLENRTLRWSTPGTLNDPYDAQFDIHIEADEDELRGLVLERLWDAWYGKEPAPAGNELGLLIRAFRDRFPKLPKEEFDEQFGEATDEGLERMKRALPGVQEELRNHLSTAKLLCLTKNPTNSLMWAHYADQHKGVVLGFRQIPEFDGPWRLARPINYLPDMPILLDKEFLADMASGRKSLDATTIIDRMIYTKSEEWAYEQEWRIFSGDGRKREAPYEDINFNANELDSVIVGCRATEEEKSYITGLARWLYPHVSTYQVKKIDRHFQFDIESFDPWR